MAEAGKTSPLRHLAGIALAVLLGFASYGLYLYVPSWLRGTAFQGLGNLVTFVAVIIALSVAERVWTYMTKRP